MQINQGYVILQTMLFDDGSGFVLGQDAKSRDPYVTWRFTKDGSHFDFSEGRFHNNTDLAEQDFQQRAADYLSQHEVKIAEQMPMQPLYHYYLTEAPVWIDTYPSSGFNPPIRIESYDRRVTAERGTLPIWGHLYYAEPLTEREIQHYELTPARYNPDVWQRMREQAQIVGRWEDEEQRPDWLRVTCWEDSLQKYLPVETTPPDQLDYCVRLIAARQAAKAQEAGKPQLPIAQQMKAAQARVDAEPRPAAPGKDAPDREDR